MRNVSILGLLVALGVAGWLWNENRELSAQLKSSILLATKFSKGDIIPIESYNARMALGRDIDTLMRKSTITSDELWNRLNKYSLTLGICVPNPCGGHTMCCDGVNVPGVFVPMSNCASNSQTNCTNVTVLNVEGIPIQCDAAGVHNSPCGYWYVEQELLRCKARKVLYGCNNEIMWYR